MRVADRANSGGNEYWQHWAADYDSLYVLFTDGNFAHPDPAHLNPIYVGRRFVLYRIQHGQLATASKTIK